MSENKKEHSSLPRLPDVPSAKLPDEFLKSTDELPNAPLDMENDQEREEYRHLNELRLAKMRRLQHLELRAAHQGISMDPSVMMEIEDLHAELAAMADKIQKIDLLFDESSHSVEQQKAVIEALAAIGVSTDQIKLISIKLG